MVIEETSTKPGAGTNTPSFTKEKEFVSYLEMINETLHIQGRIQGFLKGAGGSGSPKRQDWRNFQTDKQTQNLGGGQGQQKPGGGGGG